MHLKVTIEIEKDKWGTPLASAELKLDSDSIDTESIQGIVTGMVTSAIVRAHREMTKPAPAPAPLEVVRPTVEDAQ